MEMRPVKSSNIHSLGYDADTRTMHVRFHSGKTYEYSDIPSDLHARIFNAKSVGGALHEHVVKKGNRGKALRD